MDGNSANSFGLRIQALRKKAVAIGATRNARIAQLLSLLGQVPNSLAIAHTLEFELMKLEARHGSTPCPLPPPPEAGELYDPLNPPVIEIGNTTETGIRYGPRIDLDCGSIAITGITGGGKTTAIQNIIFSILAKLLTIRIVVFDVKGDFSCFAALAQPNIHVLKVHEETPLRLIQPPAGIALESWLTKVATYFCEYRGLKKSRHVFLDYLRRLCVHFGVDRDPTRPWPSLFNLLDYLKGQRGSKFGKDAEYKASLINELQGLLEDTGKTFDTSDGIDIIDHLLPAGGLTVLQVDSLPAPAQQMIIALVVERIIAGRVARNIHNVGLEVLVVLDEAQLVLSRRADFESANGVAPLAVQLLRGRETGVGFIVAPHLLGEVSQSVLASAKTMFVVGGLSDATGIAIAAQTMNLDYKARSVIPQLQRGQALVREIGYSSYNEAFLVDLDPPVIAKNAIDELARRAFMAPKLAGLPRTPSRPLIDYPSVMSELNGSVPVAATTSATAQAATSVLSNDERDLLLDCIRHRDNWMTERQTRLNITDYKVLQKSSNALEARKLVKNHDVRLGSAKYRLVEVLDQGFQVLGESRPLHYLGHGGLVHTALIHRVARFLTSQKWAHVQIEFPVGASRHPVDVYGRSPAGVPTAFEVTMSKSNVVSNATKTFSGSSAIQELIFLCPVSSECRSVERMLQKAPAVQSLLTRIQFRRIDEFLP